VSLATRIESGLRLVEDVWQRTIPNALEVFNYDLGVQVTETQIKKMARLFTEKFHRDPMREFVVHDACHYLLDAPPTPMGEAVVVRFQTHHSIYDTTFFGASSAVLVASLILRKAAIKDAVDRRVEQQIPWFQTRIAQLDMALAADATL
jgi:hypothetical protein